MVDITPIVAELRDRAGKGAARATRREGRVPAVIYGNKQNPVMISLEPIQLRKELNSGSFFTRIYEVSAGETKEKVLPRDVQFHPVTDAPLHVDFMRFSAKTKFNVEVVVVFLNEEESPGLKRGGVLNVVRHSIELRCSPDNIPEHIDIDLAGLDIGDGVHISNVKLPEGVESTITDRDFTIATIASPTVVKDEAAEEAAEAEAAAAEGEEGAEGAEGEGTEGGDNAGDGDKDKGSED
ncbi:MAG: 50S ribosomal protein L25/general stress protein Ctc [Rhodospirillales bacterium]|nr:50S ribosomal protein L25/general stress protein Ctc [Rhodospirillales bacterium]